MYNLDLKQTYKNGFRLPYCLPDNRVVRCDITKIKICELMRFVEIIREIKTKNVSLLRISMLVQIVGEISNDSIQILLKMAWFITLGTEPILEGFV